MLPRTAKKSTAVVPPPLHFPTVQGKGNVFEWWHLDGSYVAYCAATSPLCGIALAFPCYAALMHLPSFPQGVAVSL